MLIVYHDNHNDNVNVIRIQTYYRYCVVAVSGNSNLATDVTDVAKQPKNDWRGDHYHDDDDDVMVTTRDRCPGDGTSLDDVQVELDSFRRYRFAQ